LISLFYGLDLKLSLFQVLLLNYSSFTISLIVFFCLLKPDFSDIRGSLKILWLQNKDFGSYVYFSTLLLGGVTYLSNYVVAYYIGTTQFGLYALAFTLAYPVSLIPSILGTILFKRSVNESRYSAKSEWLTVILSIVVLCIFLLALRPLFTYLYPLEFNQSIVIANFLAFASMIQGIGDFYNKFVIASGKSKGLFKVSALIVAINLVNIIIFVREMGISGAVISQIISSCLYLIGMYILYRKVRL
jgi:O-antigen/teichoic acid export membrane protein